MLHAKRALIVLNFRFDSLPALRAKDFDLHKTAETVRNLILHTLILGAEAKDPSLEIRLSDVPFDLDSLKETEHGSPLEVIVGTAAPTHNGPAIDVELEVVE